MMSVQNWVIFVLCVQQISTDLSPREKKALWLPPDGATLDDYSDRKGFTQGSYDSLKKKVPELKNLMSKFFKLPPMKDDFTTQFDDIFLSVPQVNLLIRVYTQLLSPGGGTRIKRKIVDFSEDANRKWDISGGKKIKYIIDGTFKLSSQSEIVEAVKDWTDNTCVRFERIAAGSEPDEPHLVFINRRGCGSKLGRQPEEEGFAQSIFVAEELCPPLKGVTAHEIGHAMGFVHEHVRLDREQFVRINESNVFLSSPDVLINFEIYMQSAISTLGVPYDMGSVMHYGAFTLANDIRIPTVEALNPLFQRSMGQRTSLSFYDAKSINLAYCAGICPDRNCEVGGVANPNDCSKCSCPDGYGGNNCETVGEQHTTGCTPAQQTLDVTDTEQCLTSPNYGGSGRYSEFDECNWHLQAPNGKQIEMTFKDPFGVFCEAFIFYCQHWVEIRFKGDLSKGLPGPRFCCDEKHPDPLVSDGDKAVISFRSKLELEDSNKKKRVGFKLCFKIATNIPPTPTSTPTPTPTPKPPPGKCRVLKCSTLDEWHVGASPAVSKNKLKRAIQGCSKKFVSSAKFVAFDIALRGNPLFKLKKICVDRSGVSETTVFIGSAGGANIKSFQMQSSDKCFTPSAKQSSSVHSISVAFVKKGSKIKVGNLLVEVCLD